MRHARVRPALQADTARRSNVALNVSPAVGQHRRLSARTSKPTPPEQDRTPTGSRIGRCPHVSTSARPSRPARATNPDAGSKRRAKIEDEANTDHGEVAATGSQGCGMPPKRRKAPDARNEEARKGTTPRLVPARAWIQAMRVSQMRSLLRF